MSNNDNNDDIAGKVGDLARELLKGLDDHVGRGPDAANDVDSGRARGHVVNRPSTPTVETIGRVSVRYYPPAMRMGRRERVLVDGVRVVKRAKNLRDQITHRTLVLTALPFDTFTLFEHWVPEGETITLRVWCVGAAAIDVYGEGWVIEVIGG